LNRYRLVLTDMGGDAPAGRRLAGVLKVALRRFGLKCLTAVELAEDAEADPWAEVARLQGIVRGQAERVSRQSELLSRRAERGN
jgi:hypothetical protein